MEHLFMDLKIYPTEKYPAKQHAQRVAQELGTSDGYIYLIGQYDLAAEDSDMPPPWKQRRFFYYCSGVDIANCCLVYAIAADELVLYIPKIEPRKIVWQGRPPTIGEAKAKYDVDDVRHNDDLFGDLKKRIAKDSSAKFYILHPSHKPDPKEVKLPHLDSDVLLPAIDKCRAIKDQYEVDCIRKANDISARAHRAVLRNVRRLRNEAQIQGIFEYTLTANYSEPAYSTIAGSGKNAGILHYATNNEPLHGRQLVCLDAGGIWSNYASDVTRTFPISGHFTPEAEQIYALVELMQNRCIEKLGPGVRMIDLHEECHDLLIEGFLKLGIFHNANLETIRDAGTSRGFLPHGLGHHLGLETHDVQSVPILKYPRKDESFAAETLLERRGFAGIGRDVPATHTDQPRLEEGMVITIEPGIYFNRAELERAYLSDPVHSAWINREVLNRYWDVGGVRIEDNLLITADGFENLTTAPKGAEALEIIRHGSDCRDWADLE